MKIIIADDEEWIRYDLREALVEFIPEAEIKEAKNGRELLALCKKEEADLAFVDIKMPGISGLEALEELKPEESDTLFVILSGYADFEYARQAFRLGVDEYLLKPANTEDIKKFLEEKMPDYLNLSDRHQSQEKAAILVKQAESLVSRKFKQAIGVSEIAAELKISANYLSSQFKRRKGISFTSYITSLRMKEARKMLLEPGARVNEVSRSLGYNSSRHFAKLFFQDSGYSPSDYIRKKG